MSIFVSSVCMCVERRTGNDLERKINLLNGLSRAIRSDDINGILSVLIFKRNKKEMLYFLFVHSFIHWFIHNILSGTEEKNPFQMVLWNCSRFNPIGQSPHHTAPKKEFETENVRYASNRNDSLHKSSQRATVLQPLWRFHLVARTKKPTHTQHTANRVWGLALNIRLFFGSRADIGVMAVLLR